MFDTSGKIEYFYGIMPKFDVEPYSPEWRAMTHEAKVAHSKTIKAAKREFHRWHRRNQYQIDDFNTEQVANVNMDTLRLLNPPCALQVYKYSLL